MQNGMKQSPCAIFSPFFYARSQITRWMYAVAPSRSWLSFQAAIINHRQGVKRPRFEAQRVGQEEARSEQKLRALEFLQEGLHYIHLIMFIIGENDFKHTKQEEFTTYIVTHIYIYVYIYICIYIYICGMWMDMNG